VGKPPTSDGPEKPGYHVLPPTGDQPPTGQPQTAPARDPAPWIATPIEDRELPDHPRVSAYEAATRIAADTRMVRARLAASKAVQLARRLADGEAEWDGIATQPAFGHPAWELRGQPRTRRYFGNPHPDDFPGGLSTPREYPD
jgi:hypothetical protein